MPLAVKQEPGEQEAPQEPVAQVEQRALQEPEPPLVSVQDSIPIHPESLGEAPATWEQAAASSVEAVADSEVGSRARDRPGWVRHRTPQRSACPAQRKRADIQKQPATTQAK